MIIKDLTEIQRILLQRDYGKINLSEYLPQQVKNKIIFAQRQEEILELLKQDHQAYIKHVFNLNHDYQLVKATPNSLHFDTGEKENGQPVYQARFFLREKVAEKILPILEKQDIARRENWKLFRKIQEDPYGSFLHFAGMQKKNELPQIFLTTENYIPNNGGEGRIYVQNASYATAHDALTGDGVQDTGGTANDYNSGDGMRQCVRNFTPTDTAALPDTAIISALVFNFYPTSRLTSEDDTFQLSQSNQASNTSLATADYDQAGSGGGGTSAAYTAMTLNAYNTVTANATGRSWINVSGYSKFAQVASKDLANTAPTTRCFLSFNGVADANDPSFDITYTLPSASSSVSLSVSPSPSVSVSRSPSLSISPSPSVSVSLSISPSPSLSISPSPSVSVSRSPSLSPSFSGSDSISLSPSASVSPSSSVSSSISPSPSVSESLSVSLSGSLSLSLSPSVSASSSVSLSISPSPSVSESLSNSPSPSLSMSPSPSVSVSRSPSLSFSASPSISVSLSGSRSPSPSPSVSPSVSASSSASISASTSTGHPVHVYTREAKDALPSTKDDLSPIYTTREERDVYSYDQVVVDLNGAVNKYLIHQFKVLNDNRKDFIKIKIDAKSTLAPSSRPIYLQVWNGTTNAWETLASNAVKEAHEDLSLYYFIDTAQEKYYDFDNEVAVRIYQQNDAIGTQTLSVDLVQITFFPAWQDKYDSQEQSWQPKYPHKDAQEDDNTN